MTNLLTNKEIIFCILKFTLFFSFLATSAYTIIAVTYLIEVLKFNSTKTGLVVLVVLISIMPGSVFAKFAIRKAQCPILSLKVCIGTLIVVNFISFLTLTSPDVAYLVWPYSALWGFMLGWYYPTELHIYASIMPKGQEAELAGFHLYCTQIMVWLPPLVFTVMNENSISLSWGGVSLNIYLFISLAFYQLMPSWETCLQVGSEDNKILIFSPTGDLDAEDM